MGLTVKGSPITKTQIAVVNTGLGVAKALHASSTVMQALIYAGMGESSLGDDSNTYDAAANGGSVGVWQAQAPNYNNGRDIAGMAKGFLTGGVDFGNGFSPPMGAIAAGNTGLSAWQIANGVEDNAVWGGPSGAHGDSYASQFPGGQGQGLAEAGAIVQAFGGGAIPGGVAGLGGTGTTPNASPTSTYTFQQGSTGNPDEDDWTCINRLAQEVNWYLFSDAERLYYMDGQEMIAQEPALFLDRVKDAAVIQSLQCVWDNSAFSQVVTHQRRGKVQHQTALAKVTSPTSITLNLICPIDLYRAGDVFVLSSCGPADGRWIVGEHHRSVYEVVSEMTLVPPIAPLPEAAVGGTSATPSTATPGAITGTPNSRGVINPIPGFTITTWDMGLDVSGPRSGAPIYAPADCHVVDYLSDFYNGQPLVLYKFDRPLPGAPTQYFYVSETFKPSSTTTGTAYKQGAVVGTYLTGYSNNVEIGWGSPTANSRRYAEAVGWHVGSDYDHHSPVRASTQTWANSFQDYFGIK